MKTQGNFILTYGLLAGLVVCAISVILYLAGVDAFFGYGWLNYLVLIAVPVIGTIAARKANDGFLPFPIALKTAFGIMVVALFIQVLFNYILLNFIDVSFAQAMKQVALDKAEAMMKRFNMPQDAIDKSMDEAIKDDSNSLKNMVFAFALWCLPAFLVSLIIAAIVKRNKPAFENTFTEL